MAGMAKGKLLVSGGLRMHEVFRSLEYFISFYNYYYAYRFGNSLLNVSGDWNRNGKCFGCSANSVAN